MEAIKNFFTKDIVITNNLSLETWVFFAVAIAIILIIVVIINSAKNGKKIDENEDKSEIVVKNSQKDLSPKEASKQFFDVIDIPNDNSTKKVIPIKDKNDTNKKDKENSSIKTVKEDKPIKKDKPIKEVKENKEIKDDKPIKNNAKENIEKQTKTTKPKTTSNPPIEKKEAKKIEEEIFIKNDVEDNETFIVDVNSSGVAGKYTIVNSSLGGFRYLLLANNGQLLYESRDYKSKKTCMAAIPKFQNAVKQGTFTAKKDKFNRYKFILKPQGNVNTIYIGESFNQNSLCLSNIESVKRFVDSPIVDLTDEDIVNTSSSAYTIPKEIVEEVENNQGAKGSFEIAKVNEEDKNSPYVYLLYANNGQLLYESKEYKTYASCRNGMKTFRETVKDGVFIVDADKAGRFKFVLRSNKVGSQAEYVGQFYRNKHACESNIDSVYKFALLSPIDEL